MSSQKDEEEEDFQPLGPGLAGGQDCTNTKTKETEKTKTNKNQQKQKQTKNIDEEEDASPHFTSIVPITSVSSRPRISRHDKLVSDLSIVAPPSTRVSASSPSPIPQTNSCTSVDSPSPRKRHVARDIDDEHFPQWRSSGNEGMKYRPSRPKQRQEGDIEREREEERSILDQSQNESVRKLRDQREKEQEDQLERERVKELQEQREKERQDRIQKEEERLEKLRTQRERREKMKQEKLQKEIELQEQQQKEKEQSDRERKEKKEQQLKEKERRESVERERKEREQREKEAREREVDTTPPVGRVRSVSVDEVIEVPRNRKAVKREYRGKNTMQFPTSANTAIPIYFDGASRNNGTINAFSSAAVFVSSYDCVFSKAITLPHVLTNNAAEIEAACLALSAVLEIFDLPTSATRGPHSSFCVTGDSDIVIAALRSGRAFAYKETRGIDNSAHWGKLAELLKRIEEKKIMMEFSWVPRYLNKEADELCNCVLDNRPPNASICSLVVTPLQLDDFLRLLSLLTTRRLPTLRRIPRGLEAPWAITVATLLNIQPTLQMRRIVFLILPQLLSLEMTNCFGRHSFKILRNHINLLSDPNFFQSCVKELMAKLQQDPQPPSVREKTVEGEKKRISSLVRQELYARTLSPDDVQPANPHTTPHSLVNRLFPYDNLPVPIPDPDFVSVIFGEIIIAAKKIKKGKSPGLTGWTRELLLPTLLSGYSSLRNPITDIFTCFVNVSADLAPQELALIKTGVLTPICYKSKPEKVRPIVMTDTIAKVCWYLVLYRCIDPNGNNTSHVFGKPGACQLATAVVQAALDKGEVVVCMDAVNAYNTVSRHHTFAYIAHYRTPFTPCLRLLNAFYCSPTTARWFHNTLPVLSIEITSGTLQGCVSSLWFYTLATTRANMGFSRQLVQAADDIYIVRDALRIVDSVVVTYREGPAQEVNGPKTTILCSEQKRRSLEEMKRTQDFPASLQHATITTTPTKVLGAIVQPDRTSSIDPSTSAAVQSVLLKLQVKYDKLLSLPCSVQEKWIIPSNITVHALYYVESSSIGLPTISRFIDELQIRSFMTIFSLTELPNDHFVHLFHPIEDGGMGLFPYSEFGPIVRARMAKRAELFLERYGFRNEEKYDGPISITALRWSLWSAHMRPDVYSNRDWKVQQLAKSFLRLPPYAHESFLRFPPLNRLLTFTDEEFTFIVHHRIGCISQFPQFSCKNFSPNHSFSNHISSCNICSGTQFHRRHDAVVHAIYHCCRFHGYDVQIVKDGFAEHARPGNTKGGADLMIYVNGKVYALDVTVTKTGTELEGLKNRMNTAYHNKIVLYRRYQEVFPSHIVFPFVMSCYGSFFPQSVELLTDMCKQLRTDTHFRQDVLRHSQCALLKAIHSAFYILKAKHVSAPPQPHQERQHDED